MKPEVIADAVELGHPVPHTVLIDLDTNQQAALTNRLLKSAAGRSWLRLDPRLNSAGADALIGYDGDFRRTRRDASLADVVRLASKESVIAHSRAIAGGPAALSLWQRLRAENADFAQIALPIVGSSDRAAAEATLVHLVLDPLNALDLGDELRLGIADAGLRSPDEVIRGMAAEFVSSLAPDVLLGSFDVLIRDPSENVRGTVWAAALQLAREDARGLAIAVVSDAREDVGVRRSALVAIGTQLSTHELIDILSQLVIDNDARIAGDAADLLHRQHRNPIVAEAARLSPHSRVREIAEHLLDPYRGSPAAGGSRLGSPAQSTGEIFAAMVRSIEERVAAKDEEDGPSS